MSKLNRIGGQEVTANEFQKRNPETQRIRKQKLLCKVQKEAGDERKPRVGERLKLEKIKGVQNKKNLKLEKRETKKQWSKMNEIKKADVAFR